MPNNSNSAQSSVNERRLRPIYGKIMWSSYISQGFFCRDYSGGGCPLCQEFKGLPAYSDSVGTAKKVSL